LERGTPGPPEGIGRDLSDFREHHQKKNIVQKGSKAVSNFWRNPTNRNQHHHHHRTSKRRSSVQPISSGDHGGGGMGLARRASLMFGGGGSMNVNHEYTPEENASLVIQASFRRMKARAEMARRKVTARPGGGKHSNRLSGAVELSWRDIAARFVRYLSAHYWETSPEICQVNFLIVETWLAHLIKARTYFIDANGVKLNQDPASIAKAKSLKFMKPHQLTEDELTSYHLKQTTLNALGVTTLLAKILASLSDEVVSGGFPDRVVLLFVELLDGGNHDVQQTLFAHLIEDDNEGKFLTHIEKRLDYAYGLYLEGKKLDTTSGTGILSKDVAEACEHLIQTFRFLQLLCEGHHLGFQDYLRSQAGQASSHVNLVKKSVGMIISLCDTSFVIGRFATMEIMLVSQVLSVLIECIQGPCGGNQLVIAKSEVVSALNSIVYSKNARDEEMRAEDPNYVDLRSLSCIL
jgi:hypothetical protein